MYCLSRRVGAVLSVSLLAATTFLAVADIRMAAAAPASSAPVPGPVLPAPSQPPVLAVNDPRNTMHLTADQQKKLYDTKMRLNAEGMALIADKSMTKDQKDKKFADDQAEAIKEMRASLSPAQQALADKQQAVEKQVMMMRQKTGEQYQVLKQQLTATVTPGQKAKLMAIETAARKQYAAIQSNATLPTPQKQAKLNQLGQTYKSKIDATLNTPAQRQLMQKMLQLQAQERAAEMQAAHQ